MSAAKVSPALQMRRASRDSADAAAVERLYLRAFPDNERVPLERFWDAQEVEKEVYAFYNNNVFCGFMQLLTLRRLTHILYFAIEEQKRGAGLGGGALALLLRKKPDNVLLADIELPLADAKNYTQRRLRKQFYLNNGFAPTQVRYAWRGEEYEILSAGGGVTKEEFDRFWQYFHNRERAAARTHDMNARRHSMGYLEKAKQNGIERSIGAYKPEMLQKLTELVAIESLPTYTTPDGMPMGPEVIRALHYALELSEQLGFRTHNEDDKYGWAEVGESGPLVCIFTHLDIVPVGDGWTKEPFVVSEEDGWLYGRGILDNKGPAIASLYALKVCCDQNVDWPCRVRVYFGTNEENGMNDVQMYIHKYGAPEYSFVPDSQFPLSYSELGTSHFVIRKNYLPSRVQAPVQLVGFEIKAHANVVPPMAHVTLRAQSEALAQQICAQLSAFAAQNQYDMSAASSGCEVKVTSHGRVADHWNEPWTAVNALAQLVIFLDTLELGEEPGKLIHFVASKIGTDTDGKKLGIDATTETASLAVAMESATLDEFGLGFDFFVIAPAEIRCEVMLDTILRQLRSDSMDLIVRSLGPGFLREKDMPLLKLLYESYSDVTGNTDPIKVCGGTYAKFVPNAIPFGAIFSAQKDICHTPDERIEVEDLINWTKIYSNALLRIADYISQQK